MRRFTFGIAILIAIASPATALAGGGYQDAGRCPGFTEGNTVHMLDGCFDGVAHFVESGQTLTIVNAGVAPHTFTAVDGSFDTGIVDGGDTVTLALPSPGVYQVYCTLHGTRSGEGMAGVLIVGGSGLVAGTPPTASNDPTPVLALAGLGFVGLVILARRRIHASA